MTTRLFALGDGARSITGGARRPPGPGADGAESTNAAASRDGDGGARRPRAVGAPRAVRQPRSGLRASEPVIGYVSAPVDPDGTGSRKSRRAIEVACERAGWRLVDVLHDVESARTLKRPGLFAALERIADGEAQGLVVSDARLLGHSIVDLAPLMKWFREARAALIALDLGLDTSTPQGSRVAQALIRLSGWDRGGVVNGARGDLAGLRARDGWTRRAEDGDHAELLERVAHMRDDDMTLEEIADQLNADGVPTLNGRDMWWPSTVRTALRYARRRSVSPVDELPSLENRTRS